MYPRILNREKSPYLVLSVIIHVLFFAFIHERIKDVSQFIQKNKTENEFPFVIPHKELAALKPRASQFGIPVIFQEEPTLKDSSQKDSSDISDSTLSQPALQDSSQDLQNSEESSQESANIQKEKPIQQEESQAMAEKFDDSIVQIENIQNGNLNTSDIQKNDIHFTAVSQPTQPSQFHQPIIQNQEKSLPSQTTPQPSSHTKNAGPITRQLTFADLAQGFIQTIKNEGQDFFEREGNENIRPDLEEMKLISYKQKIVWFIQNAFRICHDAEPPHPEAIVKCCTILILNDDGSIHNLQLVYSTGVQEFDKYYLTGIKSAAPFPPIPHHIKKPFVFPFTMIYYTRPKNMTALRRPPLLRFSSK